MAISADAWDLVIVLWALLPYVIILGGFTLIVAVLVWWAWTETMHNDDDKEEDGTA